MEKIIKNKNNKLVLITGISGQDGIYLTKLLLQKNYEIHGLAHSTHSYGYKVINDLKNNHPKKIFLHQGDLRKSSNVETLIKKINPGEIYNLGAISDIRVAENRPTDVFNINFLGVLRILEAIKKFSPQAKLFQAGSLAQFSYKNKRSSSKTNELEPFSIYGKSKQLAFKSIEDYRKKYNIYACCGFMSNHDSYFRSQRATSKIIIKNIIALNRNKIKCVDSENFNIDIKKSWGHAKDFVSAMWLMLQNNNADDFIIDGAHHKSLREFYTTAFSYVGINITWSQIKGYDIATDKKTNEVVVKNKHSTNNKLYYSAPFNNVKDKLNWMPKISFEEMIHDMIKQELKSLKN